MPDLPHLFVDYADHHRHPGNKATHFVGIPLIAAALLGLGAKVHLLQLTAALAFDLLKLPPAFYADLVGQRFDTAGPSQRISDPMQVRLFEQ